MKMQKKLLSLLLSLVLVISLLPAALAAEPEGDPDRGEIITALWNAAGCPEPERAANPFSDVAADAACYKAVLWAAERGITDGTGEGRFSPELALDRATMVTFFWKMAGRPAPAAEPSAFTDVAADAWYAEAVQWAAENGVTDGTGNGQFSPAMKVSAEQLKGFMEKSYDRVLRLYALEGSYTELFPAFSLEKHLPTWTEVLAPYCESEEQLTQYYQMFTLRFMGELYGQAAVDAYAADPESAVFNCYFLNDVSRFVFRGNSLSGFDAAGKELFRHDYHYVGDESVSYFGMGMGIALHVYESNDPDSGDFRYFAFSDDTPAGEYHLEFRYGASREGLGSYTDGPYAYWLASAIPEDYDDALMDACISFFVTENLGAPETPDFYASLAGEAGTTYVNLFEVILDEKYDGIWQEYCGAVVGAEAAPATVKALKGSISGELFGEAAVAAYKDAPSYRFDCWFIHDAASFTFRPDYTATVTLTDGSALELRYEELGVYTVGGDETMYYPGYGEFCPAFDCTVFKSTVDAGEFTYLFFREDTMQTTYHLEFRYGSSLEDLQGYLKGPYAYWLAAGIDAAADEQTIRNVIGLFCLENMDFSQRSEASLAQIADLVGTWDADMSAFGEAFANVELRMTIDGTGHGLTYMNGANTADFNAYLYQTGEGRGLYVAYSNTEGEAEGAPCTLTTENGKTVLTLMSQEGTLRWIKR